mmetsp:Transcript_40694/g.99014  ORF Transcript_40694/g.99014 Transcript_40694/m.99014 type:complete len:333 (-) Transcript_40694:289-1287(-)
MRISLGCSRPSPSIFSFAEVWPAGKGGTGNSRWVAQIRVLDLSGNKLCGLPPEISLMQDLRELLCKDNWLKDIPIAMRTLGRLKVCQLKGNRLENISYLDTPKVREWSDAGHREEDRLTTLESLQLVRVGHNRLRTLPERWNELASLSMIVANDNEITMLPDKLFHSTTLLGLVLSNNKLSKIADNIALCANLRTLVLSYNGIREMPKNFCRLRNMERVHLDNNKLESVPSGWMFMVKLKHVDVHNNQLSLETIRRSDFPRLAPHMVTFIIKPGNCYGTGPFKEFQRGLSPRSMIKIDKEEEEDVAEEKTTKAKGRGRAGRAKARKQQVQEV